MCFSYRLPGSFEKGMQMRNVCSGRSHSAGWVATELDKEVVKSGHLPGQQMIIYNSYIFKQYLVFQKPV